MRLNRDPNGYTYIDNYDKNTKTTSRLQWQQNGVVELFQIANGVVVKGKTIAEPGWNPNMMLINLSTVVHGFNPTENVIYTHWLYGNDLQYGYALNIHIHTGVMQFFYLNNGAWMPSWTK